MKKKLKLFFAMGMLVVAFSAHYSDSFAQFSDMEGHYAKEAVEVWEQRGIVTGYQGRFQPKKTITRGEAAVFLDRLMNYRGEGRNNFSDLKESYYTSAILRLNKRGILQGSKEMIRPEEPITREEMAVLFSKVFDIGGMSEGGEFSDNSMISTWAYPFVNKLKAEGYIGGYQGKFHPKAKVTRAEFITLLNNMVVDVVKEPKEVDGTKYKKGFLLIRSNNVKVKGLKGVNVLVDNVTSGEIEFVGSEVGLIKLESGVENMTVRWDRSSFKEVENKAKNVSFIDEKNRLIGGLNDPEEDRTLVPLPETDRFKPIVPELQRSEKENRDSERSGRGTGEKRSDTAPSKEEEKPAEPKKPDGGDKTPQPNLPPKKEENPHPEVSKEYLILLPNLHSDGILYYFAGEKVELEQKVFIGLRQTGENSGNPLFIKWSGEGLEDLKSGKKGIYFLRVTAEEPLVINGKDYGHPEFFIQAVVE